MGEIEKNAAEKVNRILVGNKCDMNSMRRVTADEATALAKSYNINYIEASAKSNINVEQCFVGITREIITQVGKPKYV